MHEDSGGGGWKVLVDWVDGEHLIGWWECCRWRSENLDVGGRVKKGTG